MNKINLFRIKYLLLVSGVLFTLNACAAETNTPVDLEAVQMQVTVNTTTPDNAPATESGNSNIAVQGSDLESENISSSAHSAPVTTESSASPVPVTTEPSASPAPATTPSPTLPKPGVISLENLLRTALLPVGNTMYVWGGGWNEADTGAGVEALTLGVSEQWATYAAAQDSSYNYKDTRYQIHDGLDCSGYMGWVIFNVFKTENATSEEDGYVMSSTKMAETFSAYGWGEYLTTDITQWKVGDICSMSGHVWLSLGMCEDGSVLLLHASPPGVRICGTRLSDGSDSQAISLAEQIMSTHYPDWYNRYPACDVGFNYLTDSKVMRWNAETMPDAAEIQNMTAAEIAAFLFPES